MSNKEMDRKKIVLVITVSLIMLASVLFMLPAATATTVSSSHTNDKVANANYGPLSEVSGTTPVSAINTGTYTITPAPTIFNSNYQITVTIAFNPSGNMTAYQNAISNPNSIMYREYLTSNEVGSMFGLNSAAYNMIVNYFKSYGLSVTPNNMQLTLTLQGTPSQIEAAFHTAVQSFYLQYQSNGIWNPLFGNTSAKNGSLTQIPFYANTEFAYLPANIQHYVSGISGLTGMMAMPSVVMPGNMYPGEIFSATNLSAMTPSAGTTYINSANGTPFVTINPSEPWLGNYTWIPGSDVQSMVMSSSNYQVLFPGTMHILTGAENLWNGTTTISSAPDLGQGITVAVIEVGGIAPSIIGGFSQAVFGNANQTLDRFTQIGIDFSSPYAMINTGIEYGWNFETALDVEYIAAMAPMAHIDLVAVPSTDFSAFDSAYAFIAQYLTDGNSVALPANVIVMNGDNYAAGQIATAQARSITIDSNSYGSGEMYSAMTGSPMYLTVENELLTALNLVGVTNFFASGDYSPALFASATGAFMPAIATGSTSVGGGQVTAMGPNGQEFPVTSTIYNWTEYSYSGYTYGLPMYVAPAIGIASYTYWAYGGGMSGTYMGEVGGGFGQSFSLQQPWWQNAIDTYGSGARTLPVVSGSAAFNMTVFYPGEYYSDWVPFYGGTSFATPITAGEWALVEEQADMAFGTPAMGDINPMLYALHSGHEAGVSSLYTDAFVPMTNIGTGFDYSPVSSYTWYSFNLSISQPPTPIIPYWYPTLNNPAGSGWNYLQGLGMPMAYVVAEELIGQSPSTQHALMNEPFSVLQVTASGLKPFTTLIGGDTYTFQIVLANGQTGGYYNVIAYSGPASYSNGTIAGGSMTTLQTGSNGQFTYTPVYTTPNIATNATEFGYFSIVSVGSTEWAYQPFAIAQPPLKSGTLLLGVTDANGVFQTSIAEVPMFTTSEGETGYYNIFPTGTVYLNGTPIANALVSEVAVNVTYGYLDPTLPASSYASGVVIGQYLSDARGMFNYWVNAYLAENNGVLPTQIITLQATYNGLASNLVTVYVEPQSGSFEPNVHVNSAGTALVGTVTFSDMKYVNFVNISIGNAPGQFENVTYPAIYDDVASGIMESGVYYGQIAVNLTPLPTPGTPIVLSLVAYGVNDLSVSYSYSFFGYTYTYVYTDVQNPIIWADPALYTNLGTAPTASLSTGAGTIVTGIVPFTYSGSATGELSLMSAEGTTVLLTNLGTSGTYDLNTSSMLDGYYNVVYTTTTSTGLSTSSSVLIYVDNTAAMLEKQIGTLQSELNSANSVISNLESIMSSKNATISSLQTQLSEANATISALQSQITALNSEVSSLNAQLNTVTQEYQNTYIELNSTIQKLAIASQTALNDNATIISLKAQITGYQTNLSTDANTISTLNSQISASNAQISSLQSQVSSLNAQIQHMQSQISSKNNNVPTPWYDSYGLLLAGLFVIIGVVAGLIGYGAAKRQKYNKK